MGKSQKQKQKAIANREARGAPAALAPAKIPRTLENQAFEDYYKGQGFLLNRRQTSAVDDGDEHGTSH